MHAKNDLIYSSVNDVKFFSKLATETLTFSVAIYNRYLILLSNYLSLTVATRVLV